MRLVAAALFWLVTTIALTVAVPATWAQTRFIDVDGFAKLAQSAARDPRLQQAIASELTTQIVSIVEAVVTNRIRRTSAESLGLHGQLRIPGPVRSGHTDRAQVDVHRRGRPKRRSVDSRPGADAGRHLVSARAGGPGCRRAVECDDAGDGERRHATRSAAAVDHLGAVGQCRPRRCSPAWRRC